MPPETAVCAASDIPDGEARGFTLGEGTDARKIVVVRHGDRLFAYLNRCPHAGIPLDWVPGRFLSRSGEFLVCQTHNALFELEDGFCIDGPCAGDSLTPMAVRIEGGQVVVTG